MSERFESDFLKGLGGEPEKYEVATYDIETTTDLQKVYLVGFYDGSVYRYFESDPMFAEQPGSAIDQFLNWILPNQGYARYRIYAHNGGNFDHLYLTEWAMENPERVELEIIPIQSSILSLQIRPHGAHKRRLQFIDSMKLMPGSLEDIAQAFGFEGGKVKLGETQEEIQAAYETLHLNPKRYEYLQTDCELLWKCVNKFTELLLAAGGEVGITTPSTAMKVFRRSFQHGPIETNRHFPGCPSPQCRGCLHDFIRRGYYGGRTEVFRERFDKATDSLKVGDFNSMYPAVMQERLPCYLVAVESGPCDWRKYTRAWRAGFIDCTVDIPQDCYIPPLAYRHEGKLCFPTGVIRSVWTTEELKRLEQVGGQIVEQHQSVWFGTKRLFEGFVHTWYAYRNKDARDYSKSMDTIAKLMLNSLYGKFGQGEEREKIWIYPSDEELERGTLVQRPHLKEGVMKEDVFQQTAYVIPHIAAWITALARCRLWDEMQRILSSGWNVYYCDTDSIFTDAPLPGSKLLGELKLEYELQAPCHFFAPKLYCGKKIPSTPCTCKKSKRAECDMRFSQAGDRRCHEIVRAKGFGGGFGGEPLTIEKFLGVVQRGESQTVKRITKLREGLRKDSGQFPRMKEVAKTTKGKDTKRIHLADGNTRAIIIGVDT